MTVGQRVLQISIGQAFLLKVTVTLTFDLSQPLYEKGSSADHDHTIKLEVCWSQRSPVINWTSLTNGQTHKPTCGKQYTPYSLNGVITRKLMRSRNKFRIIITIDYICIKQCCHCSLTLYLNRTEKIGWFITN